MADETGAAADAIATAFAAVRDSYDMTALNGEIDDLDNKIAGGLQLELYGAVQDLLLDRLVWFLRNADLAKRPRRHRRALPQAALPRSSTALEEALPLASVEAMAARAEHAGRGRRARAARAQDREPCPRSSAATDIMLVADRTQQAGRATSAMTYFAARDFFRLDRIEAAAQRDRDVRLFRPARARSRARRAGRSDAPPDHRTCCPATSAGKDAVDAWVATRGRARWSASAPRCTRSRRPGLRCRSCRWRRACWAIWRGSDRSLPCKAGGITINAGNAGCR